MPTNPWPAYPVTHELFRDPPIEYGILPFWFLNGELDPEEMRYQLKELRAKGMPGVILHGRYGLEMPYVGEAYLDRIRFAVEEAKKLGLKIWIYDEMNWPSGTADKRVLSARPDLAQRYIECINLTTRGPWFTYLTGADSRYLDFERSTPLAAYAVSSTGEVIDLTPNLSFRDVIPWEAPAGNWRLLYIVEKTADYYIDALDPASTGEFLRLGYQPYFDKVGGEFSSQVLGYYTDEPAMHYFLTAQDNPVVPWTKDMFHRFQERNGYSLRPYLPDLFFSIRPESARVRYDFYNSLSDFYSQAYYRQIQEWCREHDVLFTGHLLFEELLRQMIRVEGNLFKHYAHMDVIGVDHLYPVIGDRDRPSEHVAMKAGSSAAHQLGSPRLLCESFGGIFMDATMQRMKWIADWEYLLGVNLLNPHGFHYTLEGPRKRDWPPSQFYQYPWWHTYADFSQYIARLSHMLSGGRHVAKVAVLWPINAMFATYTPQAHNPIGDRTENDFNALTDLLLRMHYDFDYLEEDIFAAAELAGDQIRVRDETYELLVLPPVAHMKLSTLERLEQFVGQGGRVLGMIFLPDQAFTGGGIDAGLVDIGERVHQLFGIDPRKSQEHFREQTGLDLLECQHAGGGKTAFLRSYALARQLPMRYQRALGASGWPESPYFSIETDGNAVHYYFSPPESGSGESVRLEITGEVIAERTAVENALQDALGKLISPDVIIDNREVFYLHRQKDGQEIYFLINPTKQPQTARVSLPGEIDPLRWNPATGEEGLIAPSQVDHGRTCFTLALPPVGSTFVLGKHGGGVRITDTNLNINAIEGNRVTGTGQTNEGFIRYEKNSHSMRLEAHSDESGLEYALDGEWEFEPQSDNALVIDRWLAAQEIPGQDWEAYTAPEIDGNGWLPMVPGAWSYQLPSEPGSPYPIPVWYRIPFEAAYLPEKLSLIVDGFSGSDCMLFLNGEQVTREAVRSPFDSQMKSIDIRSAARTGKNTIALRLVLTNSTDGLLDLVKIMGEFSLEATGDGGYRLQPPRRKVRSASWTEQGYPFYSGRAVYRRRFDLPAGLEPAPGRKVLLEPRLYDDVVEVRVNGKPAGVRLWEPYSMEITNLLGPGENLLELSVANTLVNLLEAVPRPSGLNGPPALVPYAQFTFHLED